MFRSIARGGVIAGGLALSVMAGAALAAPVSFQVNPSAIGESGSAFTATYIDFSYVSFVDQTATNGVGTFTEEGAGFFSSFRHPTLDDVVTNTGINSDYKLYATFTGAGNVAPTGGNVANGLTATFTSFDMNIWADPQANTELPDVSTWVGPPNNTLNFASLQNTGDDVLVGQSIGLIAGEAHVFPGLANGDFAVLVQFEPVGGFLSGPFVVGLNTADFNGVNTSLQGISPGDFTDGRIDGSGNVSFNVIPEPSSLLLLGTGMAALGWLKRKKAS